MIIHSMTATFGKLEHETLQLQPGLNILEAPNEWGKSTWCAFLTAMLYGIATREHTTKTALADKERYAPWSGSPMSGRIDLNWNGRDITIERRTKGRSVFGNFKAYETASGLPVPELTADQCGQQLLGVEKSVFLRSAFLRLSDLPVGPDEALRRRLNALVTTGDESGATDAFAQKLRDLKNRCRANRANGLIPQAEKQRDELQSRLNQLVTLQSETLRLQEQQDDWEQRIAQLQNHQQALEYAAAQADHQRLADAKAQAQAATEKLEELRHRCTGLPTRQETAQALQDLQQLLSQKAALEAESLPPAPERPKAPAVFSGMTPEQALQQAKSDRDAFIMLTKPLSPVLWILAALLLTAGIGLCFVKWYIGLPVAALCIVPVLLQLRSKKRQTQDRQTVTARYGGLAPERWVDTAQQYRQQMDAYTQACATCEALAGNLCSRSQAVQQALTQYQAPEAYTQILTAWDALSQQEMLCRQAHAHADTLSSLVRQVPAPRQTDTLTLNTVQTQQQLQDAQHRYRQLHQLLGQVAGQMQALGDGETLTAQLAQVDRRLAQLNETFEALELAQATLLEASNALQRRFAPQISQRAQTLFAHLTGNRYDRLSLSEDLSLQAGAQGEDTLHGALWRSDGTVDQLYLALRLAVAEALTPDAPMILDDALVRFDDTRLQAALQLLQQQANTRQILLFTCQSREKNLLS